MNDFDERDDKKITRLEAENARLREELATLSLYKSLAAQYGLSVFEDFAAAQKDAERYQYLRRNNVIVPDEEIDNAMKENKHD